METRILTLFTRTPLHVGAGNSVGAIDSPVMRERHTRIPVIPGSSLKGVLRDLWQTEAPEDAFWLFGNKQGERDQDKFRAGALLIGESRVLAFPVRSAKGGFAWITCPLALARYKRDAGAKFVVPCLSDENACLASGGITLGDNVIIEEYCLDQRGEPDSAILAELQGISNDDVWQEAKGRFAIVSDEVFSHFVEQACEIVTRIRIDDRTGTVAEHALFNQENVPSETLFYTAMAAQDEKGKQDNQNRSAANALGKLADRIREQGVLQVGGDETIGLGLCSAYIAERREN
jgi:CRISPR-associated protein Cmr4